MLCASFLLQITSFQQSNIETMTLYDADSYIGYWNSPQTTHQSSAQSARQSSIVSDSSSLSRNSIDTSSSGDNAASFHEIHPIFDRIYNAWYQSRHINEDDLIKLSKYHITIDDFLKLTEKRQLQKYIALIHNHIRFDEIPLRPHGQLIAYLTVYLGQQFQQGQPTCVLYGASDNGLTHLLYANLIDVYLNQGVKRPDFSFGIRPTALPNLLPTWLKFLPNGEPYPNVVIEVAVNHESS